MKVKQQNLIYTAAFDGDIFKYKCTRFSKSILWLVGLNRRIEIPVNIVLKYRKRKVLFLFTLLHLTIDKYRFGKGKPNPVHLLPILLIGRKYQPWRSMYKTMDKGIALTSKGRNIGLLHVDKDEFKQFHSKEEQQNLTQNEQQVNVYVLIRHFRSGKQVQGLKKKPLSI